MAATERYNLFVGTLIVIRIEKLLVAANNGDILGEAVISASPENSCQGGQMK
jgi:hypothetical protein